MTLLIDMSQDQLDLLRQRAESLGVRPEDLARAVIFDLVSEPDPDFKAAAEYVLTKNQKLYERLR